MDGQSYGKSLVGAMWIAGGVVLAIGIGVGLLISCIA